MKLHHIGVAVKDLDEAIARHAKLGLKLAHREKVPSQQVEVAFVGERPWIELVASTSPGSGVAKFLEKRGPGQHHLAFAVPSIIEELARQVHRGAQLIDKEPRKGAWGHHVAFLHPKDQGGVLIELVEETQ
jgi:methylmalonyl-CoA/ethylmalonyl-CoA epimerase